MNYDNSGNDLSFEKKFVNACQALARGKPIIIFDQEREHEADFAMSAKHCTPEWTNFFLHHGRGMLCIAMRPENASRIGINRLPASGGDCFDTPFGMPINLRSSTTGISVQDRSNTINAVSDLEKASSDFIWPGHVATLIAHPDGLLGRSGHTETVLDLLSHIQCDGPGVLCEILNDSGSIASFPCVTKISVKYGIPLVDLTDIKKRLLVRGGKELCTAR